MDLSQWLTGRKLVVCVGSGGVGKTTTAATIGLWAAAHGRRAIVLTIDPAKRLANSLGLSEMGGEPTPIDLRPLADAGVTLVEGGELWAMMLDSRKTFDALIGAVAPSPEARDRILANHVYRSMADALSGSQDYMATEKLHDLVRDGTWDLVVLDTPPVKNALDFLESPGRVVQFLDERVIGWFLAPLRQRGSGGGLLGGWASRLLSGPSQVMYQLLGFVFGQEFLDDFGEFLHAFQGLYEGFRARHATVMALLRSESTSFVTVCAPSDASVDVAVFFGRELGARSLPYAGAIVNQVHATLPGRLDARAALGDAADAAAFGLGDATAAGLLARLGRAHERLANLVAAEQQLIAQVRGATAGGFLQQVPRLESDVHDLPALWRVAGEIFGKPAQRG